MSIPARLRATFILIAAALASTAAANDVYLPIAGSVGIFRTDVRIFNPSLTKDITVSARFLPAGNTDNSERFGGAFPPIMLTIPKRSQAIFNDAVASIFSETGIGCVFFSSSDAILVTSRIYSQTATGTLGQGSNAAALGADSIFRGVLLQLRSDAAFRTNIGVVNPQNSVANVTFTLYDKNNQMVSQKTVAMPSFAVIGPTSIASGFFFDAGSADLSDAWVNFSSDGPVTAYASIIDNSTTDATYLAAQQDPAPSN